MSAYATPLHADCVARCLKLGDHWTCREPAFKTPTPTIAMPAGIFVIHYGQDVLFEGAKVFVGAS
jgi:hypothetical protein